MKGTCIETISPERLHELWREGQRPDLIDVRTTAEYESVHVQNAESVPLDMLDPEAVISARNGSGGEPLYIICHSGGRAMQACEKFVNSGFADVVCVEGGTAAWERSGLPVVHGRKRMSLERQVRVAAGALVLLGVTLGVVVNPYFIGLPALVGAGLVFAGVTDTCGMGMLLAKMPWNRSCCGSGACAR